MSKQILSFDVGRINLAFCLIKVTDDKCEILLWDIINLDDNDELCQSQIRGNKTCKKKAKHILIDKITQNTLYACDTHKLKMIEISPNKLSSKKCEMKSIQSISEYLFEKLDSYNLFMNADEVIIENQPSFKNPKMKTISAFLFSYFTLRKFDNKGTTNLKIVKFVSPLNKLKLNISEEDREQIKNTHDKKKYELTKNLSIKYCSLLINDEQKEHLNKYKKKDDLCDAFLQGYQYITIKTKIKK